MSDSSSAVTLKDFPVLVWNRAVGGTEVNQVAPKSTGGVVVMMLWWSEGAVIVMQWRSGGVVMMQWWSGSASGDEAVVVWRCSDVTGGLEVQ